jgi:hypothetical protein
MLLPLNEMTTAAVDAEVVAVLMKLMFRSVTPLELLDPIVRAAVGAAMVTWFCDQSEADVAVAPTIVTVAVPGTLTASEYVPGRIVTEAMPLF